MPAQNGRPWHVVGMVEGRGRQGASLRAGQSGRECAQGTQAACGRHAGVLQPQVLETMANCRPAEVRRENWRVGGAQAGLRDQGRGSGGTPARCSPCGVVVGYHVIAAFSNNLPSCGVHDDSAKAAAGALHQARLFRQLNRPSHVGHMPLLRIISGHSARALLLGLYQGACWGTWEPDGMPQAIYLLNTCNRKVRQWHTPSRPHAAPCCSRPPAGQNAARMPAFLSRCCTWQTQSRPKTGRRCTASQLHRKLMPAAG